MGKTYLFDTSRGAGIPGLPHEIDDAWLKANPDMEPVFKEALKNGFYKEKAEPKPRTASRKKE